MGSNTVYRPAFVFNGKVSTGSTQPAAVTVSHEAGHNFGLAHDGITIDTSSAAAVNLPTRIVQGASSYLQWIKGSSSTQWGPLMGAPFWVDITQVRPSGAHFLTSFH
jgi:hypothetical protein